MRSRRLPHCRCCDLPEPLCLGPDRPAFVPRTRVALVVHHVEARKPSNTGRLAHLVLGGSTLRVRGLRDADALPSPPAGRRLVLYPGRDARVLSPGDAGGDALTLLVPDGSWEQARRMVRRDPWLRDGELVCLPDVGPSRYRLRRTARTDALCTFEAVARALGVLEGVEFERTLLGVLDAFVARTLALRGVPQVGVVAGDRAR
jgi:DTW domain-containing protein YfiP